MTPEEKFQFDLHGYLHLKSVLMPAELAVLDRLAEEQHSVVREPLAERTVPRVLSWGDECLKLLDHPRVLPYLYGILGSRFRLDHDYGIFMQTGSSRGPLHGSEGGMSDWWYSCRNGEIRNGLCALIYFLTPARSGEGGFACIPGSHKSQFVADIPRDVRNFERPATYLFQPAVEAGDAVLFTEALVHGTMPWHGASERRILVFKYGPGHCASSENYYDLESMPTLTERQRLLLTPPSLYTRPEIKL